METSQFFEFSADITHVGADDNLKLPILGHDALHAIQALQSFYIGFFMIFQLKAQPGHAVCDTGNIFFAAHQPQDVCCHFGTIHRIPPFLDAGPKAHK